MASTELSDEDKFSRILYVTNLENRFISGDPVKYKRWDDEDTLTFLNEVFENKIDVLETKMKLAGSDLGFPRRNHIFYILAKALHSPKMNNDNKDKISQLANAVAKSDQEFFDFIQYCAGERKLGGKNTLSHSAIKAVKRFYLQKSEIELVETYVRAHRYHSWSHKDLFKLAHIHPDTPLKDVIVKYIMFKKPNDRVDEQEKALIDKMIKSQTVRSTSEEEVAVPIIFDLKCTIKQVNPSLYKSEKVWLAALENMPIQDSLSCLPRLYKAGLLKANSPVLQLLVNNITDAEKIKSSKIHPLEVFIHWKNFEKGGRPIDAKLVDYLKNVKGKSEEELKKIVAAREVKCPQMFSALQKCMHLACGNISVAHKRYMITIDTSELMRTQACVTTKTVSCLEAAVAYAHILIKVEKDVIVATFNDKGVKVIDLQKKGSYSDHFEKIASNKCSYIQYNSPMEWSISKNCNVDIFVNFCHHMCLTTMPKEVKDKMPRSSSDVLIKYRNRRNLPNTKLIFWCPSSVRFLPAKGNYRGLLNAAGFDVPLCKAVDAFSRGCWV